MRPTNACGDSRDANNQFDIDAASIVQGPNGLQPTIKIENTGSYYCNSYTPPGPDHSVLMGSGTYSKNECNQWIIDLISLSYSWRNITDKKFINVVFNFNFANF